MKGLKAKLGNRLGLFCTVAVAQTTKTERGEFDIQAAAQKTRSRSAVKSSCRCWAPHSR